MSKPHVYRSILAATRGVLVEACSLLNAAEVDYVVVGGWVPFIRSTGHTLQHPGTRDVDLLINGDAERVKEAVLLFWNAGYSPSAKHPFQLLKQMTVEEESGSVRQFTFNVDLMHPMEECAAGDDLFQDIIDLGVRIADNFPETQRLKSIIFLSPEIIFDSELWSNVTVNGTLPDGTVVSQAIPLMNEVGLILSKSESFKNSKRGRDSFDIFYTLNDPVGEVVARELIDISRKNASVRDQIESLCNFLRERPDLFNKRVAEYAKDALPPNCAQFVLGRLSA